MSRSSIRRWALAVLTSVALVTGLVAAPVTAGAAGRAAPVQLDLGSLGKAAALNQCATKRFVDGKPRKLRVLYGMKQRTPSGSRGSFVLRNHAGKVMFCDMFGRDRPSRLPLPRPTAQRVAVHATNPDQRAICDEAGVRTGMRYAEFLRVKDPVRSARTRFWVDGVAQPWFTSKRQRGFVHLQSWQRGLDGAKVQVQTQLRNRAGTVLSVPGMSSKPRTIPQGCVQIG
jgi:hypothetical protein